MPADYTKRLSEKSTSSNSWREVADELDGLSPRAPSPYPPARFFVHNTFGPFLSPEHATTKP